MRLDTQDKFIDTFEPSRPVTQQLLDIQRHQTSGDFSTRWSQNLRFITVAGDYALDSELPEYSSSSEESETSSQASHESELLSLPPKDAFQPKSSCRCQKNRRFPKDSVPDLRITTKSPAEFPGCTHYVAISYCWEKNLGTESLQRRLPQSQRATTQYSVRTETGERSNNAPSKIIGRAIAFAAHYGVRLIWIDQECIVQDDREDKKQGIQSMDLVYQQALHAVALLPNARITSSSHAEAFTKALAGEDLTFHECEHALEVFEAVAADRWLSRAWCYQETAAAGETARLLISSQVNLAGDGVPGEFEVTVFEMRTGVSWVAVQADSILDDVSRAWTNPATDLADRAEKVSRTIMDMCPVAYQAGPRNPRFRYGCNAAEALYLLSDRKNSRNEDRLAILANICNFSTRLNTETLKESEKLTGREYSFSLCFAVLAILNGDLSLLVSARIQIESSAEAEGPSDKLVSAFDAPSWMPAGNIRLSSLSYIGEFHPRIFRMKRPVISSEGLVLSGHMWIVDQKIDLHSVQVQHIAEWHTSMSGAGISKELIQDIFRAIVRTLCSVRSFAVAECIWHRVRHRPEKDEGEGLVDKIDSLAAAFKGGTDGVISSAVCLEDIGTEFSSVLCASWVDANSDCAWIARRVMESGAFWCGRSAYGPGNVCVFDRDGPSYLLTPQGDGLEGYPRSILVGRPISWILRETGRSSEDGEIFKGLDLVCGIWRLSSNDPKQYVLE